MCAFKGAKMSQTDKEIGKLESILQEGRSRAVISSPIMRMICEKIFGNFATRMKIVKKFTSRKKSASTEYAYYPACKSTRNTSTVRFRSFNGVEIFKTCKCTYLRLIQRYYKITLMSSYILTICGMSNGRTASSYT